MQTVHKAAMDIEWFRNQKKELGINDTVIGEAIGRDRSTANRVITGKTPFDLQHAPALARLFQVSVEDLLRRVGAIPDEQVASNASVVRMEGASAQKPQANLPVYGTALAAAKAVDDDAVEQTTLNRSEVIHYVKRPVFLNGVKNAYALHVQGSSMHPALPDGEMVVVVPEMPLSVGDNVVVYLRPDDPDEDDGQTARAVLVKELVRRTARYVELRQYVPAMDFRLEMDKVIRIDRVLSRKEMLS